MPQRRDYRSPSENTHGIDRKPIEKDLMLVRLGLDDSRIEVDLTVDWDQGEASVRCCPDDDLCARCRKGIRHEAQAWLHELSQSYPMSMN